MDHCLSVLKAFPPENLYLKEEAYHTGIRSHLASLDGLLAKHLGNLVAHAEAVLAVSLCPIGRALLCHNY